MPRALEAFALHRLSADGDRVVELGAVDLDALAPEVRARLDEYLVRVMDERGALDRHAGAARWRDGQPAVLSRLETCPAEEFAATAAAAARRLGEDRTARPGLLLFVRGQDEDGDTFLACMKVELGSVDHLRWDAGADDATSAIVQTIVTEVLPRAKGLQKAAALPGPDGADLWVVDELKAGAPADYWLRFLGAEMGLSPRVTFQRLTDATETVLREDRRYEAGPLAPVAKAVALAAESRVAVLPERFVQDVAAAAQVPDLADRIRARAPELLDAANAVDPDVARDAKTVYELGGGLKLTGARSQLEQRVREYERDRKRYVEVLVTGSARIKHR